MSIEPTGYVDPIAAAELEDAIDVHWSDIFDLYPQQEDFCTGSSAMYQLWIAGRGTGKSFSLFGPKALYLALKNPGVFLPGGRVRYCPGVMLGRTLDEVEGVHDGFWLDAVARFQEVTGINLIAWYSGKQGRYTLVNGAQVFQRSYGRRDSLKKIRGRTFAWALMDEVMFAEVESQEAMMTVAATLRHKPCAERQLALATSPDGHRGAVAYFVDKWLEKDPDFYIQTATVFDNPHIDDQFRDALRKGCTDRQWAAEGLGKVLRPVRSVYQDFNAATHVVPWTWDRTLPWLLCVDWGESWGWVGAVQVVDRDDYEGRDGTAFPNGTWIVAKEWVMIDGNRPKQRRKILEWINKLGYPRHAAADRAVKNENQWLVGVVGDDCPVSTLIKTDEIKRSWGIGALSFMLNPGSGKPPRLYFADSLESQLDRRSGTIRSAMSSYSYLEFRLDGGEKIVTNRAEVNTPPTHSCDALRYGVCCTIYDERLHGGRPLPYVQTAAHQERDESTIRDKRSMKRRRR